MHMLDGLKCCQCGKPATCGSQDILKAGDLDSGSYKIGGRGLKFYCDAHFVESRTIYVDFLPEDVA